MDSLVSRRLKLRNLLCVMCLLIVESLLVESLEFMHSLVCLKFEIVLHGSDLLLFRDNDARNGIFFLSDSIDSISLLPDFVLEQLVLVPLLL